jgi:23S rRNA (guanosine2251-2'-O)-methyltransferase
MYLIGTYSNVGSIFRTAETAGTALVVTCGITCHPPHPKLMKTALSSVESVPTRHFESVMEAIEWLRADGWSIVVMETTERSEEYSSTAYPPKTALVVGNEVSGVDVRLIALADKVVQIPTYGVKNSLNVASALPIVLFEVLRQWKQRPNPL